MDNIFLGGRRRRYDRKGRTGRWHGDGGAVRRDGRGADVSCWRSGRWSCGAVGGERRVETAHRAGTGAISWNEYMSSDADKSKAFFEAVLGVTFFADPGMCGHTMMMVDGAPVAGVIQRMEQMPELANPWLVYFAVDDCDAAFAKGTSTGASVIVPPMDIPPGRFSIMKDPQGAEFAVMQGNPDYSPGG